MRAQGNPNPREANMASNDNHKQAAEQASNDKDLDAQQVMDRLAEAGEVPSDPRDWPGGKAKFLTFGGNGPDDRYGEGATAKLGPAEVMHLAGGAVTVGGVLVDNPGDFKGVPIPGGPTDPNSPALGGERKRQAAVSGPRSTTPAGV